MTCDVNKIDSNVTGLKITEEECLGERYASPVWHILEPNSYSDFGATITTVARAPIRESRQRQKGMVTDMDAAAGFQADLTFDIAERLLPGFLFADPRVQQSTTATATDNSGEYTVADEAGFNTGDIIEVTGMAAAGNNGIKNISTTGTNAITVSETTTVSAAQTGSIRRIGHKFTTGNVSISKPANLVILNDSGSGLDKLGLLAGQWIKITGLTQTGYARVKTIAAGSLELDKVSWPSPAAEAGAGKTVTIHLPTVIRNEPATVDIIRRSYTLERTLGKDGNGVMSEYVQGAIPNSMTINIPEADKVTLDVEMPGTDYNVRDGTAGPLSEDGGASTATLAPQVALNTSSDIKRIKLGVVDPVHSNVTPLFAFVTEASITINNNVTPSKAVGHLGAIDANAGIFEVGGSITAYFADTLASAAVRNSSDVTLDYVFEKDGKGMVIDLPFMTLGNGRLDVTAGQAIMIPLDPLAAQSDYGHTLLVCLFDNL